MLQSSFDVSAKSINTQLLKNWFPLLFHLFTDWGHVGQTSRIWVKTVSGRLLTLGLINATLDGKKALSMWVMSWLTTSVKISEEVGGFLCSNNVECSVPSRWRKSWQPWVCWRVPTRGLGVCLGARGNALPLLWSWWTTPLSCSSMNPPGTSKLKTEKYSFTE